MGKLEGITHQQAKMRLLQLIKKAGMSCLGFEVLLGYTSGGKYISAIKNGNKLVTNSMINCVTEKFGFEEGDFKNLELEFDETKINNTLEQFEKDNIKTDDSKFYETENQTKSAIKLLIKQGFFEEKRKTNDILEKLKELGLYYTSNDLSRDLANIVTQEILAAEKTINIRKDGSLGNKKVKEYWAP